MINYRWPTPPVDWGFYAAVLHWVLHHRQLLVLSLHFFPGVS